MAWRPLDRLGSIKLKLSVVIVGAIVIAAIVSVVGYSLGVPVLVRPVISAAIGVVGMWFFAGGITSPLREMSRAAGQMAEGDYDIRVSDSSQDEVGDLARAFNAMAGELAEVDQQRRDLVAMVSHELRTPITALQANLENLIDGVSEPEPDLLNRMLSQTERLGRLVAQLLDLSRLESGALALERLSVDATALVGRVVDEARLRHPDLLIETSIEPADVRLVADAERLHQVLANLVDNAARYSPEHTPVALDVGEDRGQITFRVTD
ncbi:MAG: HAMP domain-containing protein, partial [Actinomycetia bacterium]|nr:HAMP domain-containing protein [Actinomycetes bacterium]